MTRDDSRVGIRSDSDVEQRRTLYSSHRWRRVRADYLAKHRWCLHCGDHATVVDHAQGHGRDWRASFWDQRSWQPLCTACHGRKTATQDQMVNGARGRAARNGFVTSPCLPAARGQVPGGNGEKVACTYPRLSTVPEKYSGPSLAKPLPADSAQFLAARYLTNDREE